MLLAGHYSLQHIGLCSAHLTHKFSLNVPGLQSDNVQYPQLPDSFDMDDPDQAGVAHPGELLHLSMLGLPCSVYVQAQLHSVHKPAQELSSQCPENANWGHLLCG